MIWYDGICARSLRQIARQIAQAPRPVASEYFLWYSKRVEPSKQNYLSKIATEITRHVIAPAHSTGLPGQAEASLYLGNFPTFFIEYRVNSETGAYRHLPADHEIRILIESLANFEKLKRAVYKLRDHPVLEALLDDEEERALKTAEDIMAPADRFFERTAQPREIPIPIPLRCVLENREPTELEVIESVSKFRVSQDEVDAKITRNNDRLERYRDFEGKVIELRNAYFSGRDE